MVVDEGMDGLAKNCGAAYAGDLAGEAQSPRDFRSGNLHAYGSLRLNIGQFAQRVGRAIGDDLAVIDVRHVAAALGFVHVVRGDEESDPVPGEFKQEIPKQAASHRVDAGGGLVQEKKFGLMEHGAAQSEPLLPSAGKLCRQAVHVRREAVELDDFLDAAFQSPCFEAVDAPVELQILSDREVLIETVVL